MIRVQKGNAQYRIAEDKLAAYEKRGFVVCESAKAPAGGKPVSQMNKAELLALAASLGIEVPAGATNAAIQALIEAAQN